MPTVLATACTRDCPDACSILAHVEEGRVVRIQGDPAHPVTRGFLCQRTSRYLERHEDPERVATPLLRRGARLEPIGWDEALDLAAGELRRIRDEHGPAAILHYRSGGSLGLMKHVVEHFFGRFGPVTGKRGDICSGAGEAAQLVDFGTSDSNDLFDLLESRHVLLWGKNPYVSNVHLLPVLKEAARRGARLALIDPIRHRTAELADLYVQIRPGGDLDLALGIGRVLFDRGGVDPDAASYCDGLEGYRSLVGSRPAVEWARRAGVEIGVVEELARRMADRPAAIQVGWGMQRRAHGGAIVRALDALGTVTGNMGVPGGGVSFYFKRRGAFDTAPFEVPPPRTLSEPLLGREILEAKDPAIRAVWITAGNPVAMLPDSAAVARALETREFVVVVDTHLTDTARRAHLVLPATSMLEDDDVVGAYGNHYVHSVRPVAPRRGEPRTDLEIVSGLAARLGLGAEFSLSARDWKRRLLRPGLSLEQVEAGGARSPAARKVLFEGNRFATPSGRANLLTAVPAEAPADPDHPLWLFSNSPAAAQASQWSGARPREAVATCHPDAASGFADGDLARLESRLGSMSVRLRFDSNQRRDVVLVPKGGWFDEGTSANAIIPATLTDLGEGAPYLDPA